MLKTILLTVQLFFVIVAFSQEVISTQGGTFSSANASMDYTIGEVVIDTDTDGNNDLTQGFHQTNWVFLGVEDHVETYEATIYPNPTSDILKLESDSYEGVVYRLFDANGKLILTNQLTNEVTSIQVNHLAAGNYSLVLMKNNNLLKTFKLSKIH